MTEIFTSKSKRTEYVKTAKFNCYGGTGCDLIEVKPNDLTELVTQSNAQFH